MNKKSLFFVIFFVAIDVILLVYLLLHGKSIPLLNPSGMIGIYQRNLAYFAVFLMLILAVPVFLFMIFVVLRYREGNTKSAYTPDWHKSTKLQIFWWSFPFMLISLLAVVTWVYTHKLDPHEPIAHAAEPVEIQVVALRYKWLFIYPELGIASVNYFAIPEKTPVNFQLTADNTPMNSFWVPDLGGQIYAMAGMSTKLHLIADTTGKYRGSNAEISGAGFAGMTFTAESMTGTGFTTWVDTVRQSPQKLAIDEYNRLMQPSEKHPITYYSAVEDKLYSKIIMKYMAPQVEDGHDESEVVEDMEGMSH